MKEVKLAVSKNCKSAATGRIIAAIIFGGMISTLIYMGIEKWLTFCLYSPETISAIKTIWEYGGTPIIILAIAFYIFKTLRRSYAYGYMQDYFYKLKVNNYTTCPRCGNRIAEKQGVGSYSKHVGDKITTTTYSDGSKTVSKQGIYQSQSYNYTYYQCTNPSCALNDKGALKFGNMPYSRKSLRYLILNDGYYKHSAASLVDGSKKFTKIIITALLVVVVLFVTLSNRNGMEQIYGQFGGREIEGINVSAQLEKEEKDMLSKMKAMVKDAKEYVLAIEEIEAGLVVSENDLDVTYFTDEKLGNGFTYDFDGVENDLGLEGEYTLMPYNGKTSLFCDEEEVIYPPDSETYKTHYEYLKTLDGKKIMTDLLNSIKTGELYEQYTDKYVIRSDKIYATIVEDGTLHLLDERDDTKTRYAFVPCDTEKPDNYANYNLAGATETETDELQKLLNSGDYKTYVEFGKDEKEIEEFTCVDNGDGSYTFTVPNDYDLFTRGEYTIYPAKEIFEFIAYTNDIYTKSEKTEYFTKKSAKEKYERLNGLIPDNFVKANFNFENATEKNLFGFAQYTLEKDGKKAVLEVHGDTVENFTLTEADGTYIEIVW